MRKKLFTLLFAFAASIGTMFAEIVQIGDLYYNLNATNQTAEVTSQNSSYPYWSKSITIANIPSSVTYNSVIYSVTSIGEWAFTYCSGLTSVTIPNSVTSIGVCAFQYCTSLISIEIPNSVTSIGSSAFQDVPNIVYNGTATGSPWGARSINGFVDGYCVYSDETETTLIACSAATKGKITIPSSVTSIGDRAFFNCYGLTSVTIPNSVTSIGNDAFWRCSGLTSVTIPNSVTSIGNDAFYGCSGLPVIDNLRYADTYLVGAVDKSLSTYNIKQRTKWIGEDAFSKCYSLTSVTIPNSVTNIGESAFEGCSKLTSVTIGDSVTNIGEKAFYECSSLTSVYITDIAAWCAISFESFANPLSYAHNLYLNGSLVTNLVIPNSVTSIGSYAFYGYTSLTSVTIPNSVTSIGSYAFSACRSLTSVTIPNSVTSIGSDAFNNCTGLTSVTIPNSVTSIGSHAFYDVLNIIYNGTATGSPWGAQSVNGYVEVPILYNDISKTEVRGCLKNYKGEITIPNSVTSIGSNAFRGCSGLTSVTIPNSVTSIGGSAFYNCTGLTSVTIPNSVTSIGSSAFSYCSKLANIYVEATNPPSISSTTFSNIASEALVHVQFGYAGLYRSANYWKNMNIQVVINHSILTSPTGVNVGFTTDGDIASCGIEGGEQQPGNVLEYIGLEPNSEYNNVPIVLTANTGETETVNISFTTTALELTTKPSKAVSSTTAILLAETNMSDAEVSCGFEYNRNDAPADMEGNKVYCPVASGQMAGRLKGLKDDVYYKYRAFYQSAAGNMFYGDWQYIFTGDVAVEFDPILYTYGATVVRENEATISGYALAGSEDFTEQGFEYWAESRTNGGANAPHRVPAALNEHFFVQASGIALRATLTNLDAGTVYKYRVYGKVGDQYYYGAEQSFATSGTYTPPTYTVTFANWDGAVLQSSQVEDGKMPIYSGETPVRPEDEQYIYTFNGWSPAIVAATADATYTAQYVAKDKHEGLEDIQEDNIPCTKVVRNGQIFILRGEKEYTLTGQEIK